MFDWFKKHKGLRIRDAKPKDIPVVTEIFRRTLPVVYKGIIPRAHMAKRIKEAEIALNGTWPLGLVVEEGGTVGGIALVRDGSHLAIMWLDEQFCGRGIGSQLLTEVEQRIAQKGCTRMTLEVYKDNERAIRFYSKLGWRVIKEYPGRVGAIVLDMEKHLTKLTR